MFNKEFLKNLTVLYVEDDESIRNSLSNILKKIFAKVILCKDGEEGLTKFHEYQKEKKFQIDVIITDINMPNKNGIEFIKEIRDFDQDVPVIFTTGHDRTEYLMEAINLKIAYYALKPINTSKLLDNISKVCMIEHNKNVILQKSSQLNSYMKIMENIASIFKVDNLGHIVEANELMSEISEYSKEELLTMNINDILNQDTVSLIDNSDLFKIQLKCTSKSKATFYLNATVITSKNEYTDNVEGYVYICIDQTEDAIKKKQTMQRVRKNIILQRTKESELLKLTKELEKEIEVIKSSTINSKDTKIILASLAKEKQKVSYLNSQISYYEQEIVKLKKMQEKIDINKKAKRLETIQKQEQYTNEKEKFQSKIIELQSLLSQQEAKFKAKIID